MEPGDLVKRGWGDGGGAWGIAISNHLLGLGLLRASSARALPLTVRGQVSGDANHVDWSPHPCLLLCLHLPEATNSCPHLHLSDPSPSTVVPTFDLSPGYVALQSDPPGEGRVGV